jgi:hypothetical protein
MYKEKKRGEKNRKACLEMYGVIETIEIVVW